MKLAADTTIPDSPESIAAMIAAADRRIGALSRAVERCLAPTAREQQPAASVTPPAPPPQPAVSVTTRPQSTAPVSPVLPSPVSQASRDWWLPVAAAAAFVVAAAVVLFILWLRPTTPPSASQPRPQVELAGCANATMAAAVQSDVRSSLTMTLVASGRCWIRALADGAKSIERVVGAGDTVQLSGEDQIVLRVETPRE